MTSHVTTWRAHAKLTLSLHVTGLRDDGYHLIDAEMVSLELHDLLTFRTRPGGDDAVTTLDTVGPFADGVPTDRSNLVARALDLAGRTATVTIDKRIPHGGGLGGGSTDAATALRWSGFGAEPDQASLVRASALGADIPFCLAGGRARVRGIGEIVDPLPHIERAITLVIPPLQISTPAAYRAWDELAAGEPRRSTGSNGQARNDLEAAAIIVEPELATWRDLIADRIGVAPILAGSGATWFAQGDHSEPLADLEARGATVVVTRTVDAGRATGPGT